MTTATAGSGLKWVGRAIRRLEDPTLVTGRGFFTADLAARHHLRFVRSPVASGRIVRLRAPTGTNIVTIADLAGARPIRPMLHKFAYQPIEQPLLAKDVVRFVGEPIAAVWAPSAAEAEDLADRVDVEIEELPGAIDAHAALVADAPRVHKSGNVVVDGSIKTADFDATLAKAHRRIRLDVRSHRQNAA
ncbi:MAG: hypothetical protein WAM40_14940, partial [Xanthobacteraceae bacterium]